MEVKSKEWYEVQYSPNKWVKRLPADNVILKHIKLCNKRSDRVRQYLEAELDVPYGRDRAKIDFFYPNKRQDKSPVVMFIHGGKWKNGSKDMHSFISNSLVNEGIIAAIVGYNLAPEASMDEMVDEIQAAVKFVAKKFSESKVFLCGNSSGAQLCAMVTVRQWINPSSLDIHGIFLISGIYDLNPVLNTYANDALKLNETSASRNSPLLILKQSPPTRHCPAFIAVEEHGSPEFTRQSKELAEVLKSRNVPCTFLEVPGMDHFNIIEEIFHPAFSLSRELVKFVNGGKLKMKPLGSSL